MTPLKTRISVTQAEQTLLHQCQRRIRPVAGVIIFLLGIFAVLGNAESKNTPSMTVEIQNGRLLIEAHDIRLGDLLDKLCSVGHFEIRGLSQREDEPINFVSGNESVEGELKRLLRYLNVQNYALEYGNDQLRRVSIYPQSEAKSPELPLPSGSEPETRIRQSSVVKVEGLIEGSQADRLNLKEGDLVISYDNIRISTAPQLVRLVKSKQEWEKTEMIIVRDESPARLVVNGGQIGIQIKTVRIPSETLKQYYSSL